MYKYLLVAFLFIGLNSQAQKKVKGSRNVTTKQSDIKPFTSIELDGEFEVGLLKGSRSMVEVEADDNLHDLIQIEVVNNVLYIKPSTKITNSKSQKLTITFNDSLTKITVDGKVEFESLQELYLNDFEFIAKGKSKSEFSATTNSFKLNNFGNAKVVVEITSEEISLELKESSDLEGSLKSPLLFVKALDKSSAKLKGAVDELNLSAAKSARFDGEKLTSKTAEVFTTGNSKNRINVSKSLKLSAKDKSEIDLYNSPDINLVEFSQKAILSKKN
ncbi:GIN domain-containing protein [Gillisia hiemivivida]|jgi:hypothetical protein|uniref:Putative auto-transporter adhesin head GIN domain-containing protein n=1 Tax=Gillisia hiemivivida TaxID=291190 RepID=A0A5C6ZYC4_9FLAO|nr:DUF2807 domain-containing protein [Gillisia hiemivivida]TXD95311.1 hypothetical protein ES724_03935 [Gillisia hiemivivida]